MASDGTNVVRVTDQGYAVSPSWSPNGQFLAFAWVRHYGPGAPGASDIYVMDVASQQWVQLTHDGGRNDFPSWSPDGRHIVFQSNRTGKAQIWTMLADGSETRQLTTYGRKFAAQLEFQVIVKDFRNAYGRREGAHFGPAIELMRVLSQQMEEELKLTRSQWMKVVVALAVVLAVSACGKKKAAPPPPPPPPPAPAPTASLTANPNTINAGQSTTLIWKTDYATSVTIDQLGTVDPSGSRTVTPTESTTYHLIAKNDSGTQEATARVTVNQLRHRLPPPRPPMRLRLSCSRRT